MKDRRQLQLPCIAEFDQALDETLVNKGIVLLREAKAAFAAAKCPKTTAKVETALSSALGARRNVLARPYRIDRPRSK